MIMKKLSTLLQEVTYKKHCILEGLLITGIQYDSRKVQLGNVFVAIKGFEQDGHQYIQQALDNGAIAIVVTDESYCGYDYPWVLVEDARLALAQLSNAYYEHPSQKLKLIGVTGTNGKTTTSNLICEILAAQGKTTGLIGTIHNRIGDRILEGDRTTPESLELQQILAEMVAENIQYVVMEVSSHALELQRVACCDFDVAVFTNLTQDHLDYHETMEKYCQAKTILFSMMGAGGEKAGLQKLAVINLDDAWATRFMVASNVPVITYGIQKEASWKAENVQVTANGVHYVVDDYPVNLQLNGEFNVYNSLAALAVGEALGFPVEEVITALEKVAGVNGRFQAVEGAEDYTVIVDYAHTPDGLRNVIETAKAFAAGRVITVFGCGGDRDKTKRPIMGKVAAQLSDYCVVTSDNPRTENPESILQDILPGVEMMMQPEQYHVEVDRRKAIQFAVDMAKSGDVILLAGKGHENYQDVQGVKHHFDDYEEAKIAIENKKNS
ncbi:MAG: UDP-N-acetylmuramoyl-L-alanyl-D-glutamate--2,6-diaminopimelate ligase [Peptococcaceae bacterium]|nr:UDP-N-acetylmuramoyl-L-alanyl-D-glutamate--2,6-diaminopimelate ligase [Peptococcaceae bacterium]